MSARKAKQRALLRMQRHPVPHSKFVPVNRYRGRGSRAAQVFQMELGTWENFRFITSPLLDVLRESFFPDVRRE